MNLKKWILTFMAFSMIAITASAQHVGAVGGHVFNDLNRNGIDNNEPRLSGFMISLQGLSNSSIYMEAITDSQGGYAFTHMPKGTYRVCAHAPVVTPPWTPTTLLCRNVTLTSKVQFAHVRFGFAREGSVTTGGTGGGTTGVTTGGTGGGTTGVTTGGTGGGTTGVTTGGTGGGTTGGNGGELGCTRTQGWWGNAPAGQQRLVQLVTAVGGITLGNRVYSAAELDAILDSPTRGNALVILAQQLIAAKLNVMNGADDSAISADIALAESLIGSRVIPPVGNSVVRTNTALGQQMVEVAARLDDYNNGKLNVPHCN
jgi:hypothetical protein